MVERLRVEEIFVIFLGALIVMVKCENCALAPTCPDISTWKPGFICQNDFIAIIKSRFVDGFKKKTICCRAINRRCNEQLWCKPQNSNIQVFIENSSLPTRTSCSSGCSPIWKEFDISSNISHDGVRAGSFSPGISAFIGRALVNGELQIGRIQISHPTGLFYTFDGSVRFANSSIEYLKNSNFIWQNSSHGALVRNAVTVTAVKNLPFYIGRIQVNGLSYVGTVVRVLGLMYYGDENGIERTTDCYEVLTCQTSGLGDGIAGIVESPESWTFSNAEHPTNIEFESTTSSIAAVIELSTHSSTLDSHSTLSPTDHPSKHPDSSGSFSTVSATEFLNSWPNSSQIPIIVDETINEDIHNSSGYSYNPPLMSLSLSTSTAQFQYNFYSTESTASHATSTESSNPLIEAFPAHESSNASESSQSNPASSSHLSQNAQSSTIDPISVHSWTQLSPLALNDSTLMQSMSQMSSISSSTEKVAATITAENNNEVHNVNVEEQIASEQLTSSAVAMGNGDNLEGNWGENSWSNVSGIGGDFGMNLNKKPDDGSSSLSGEILGQIDGNSSQIVVENEGGIEGPNNGLNYNQDISTENVEHEVGHAIENAGVAAISHNNQPLEHQGHLTTENSSQNPATQSLTTTESQATTTKASYSSLASSDMNSFIDLSSSAFTATETSIVSSFSNIPTALPESNESETSSLSILVSTEPSQIVTSKSNKTSTNQDDFTNQTSTFNAQVTKKPTKPQEFFTTAAEFSNPSPVHSASTSLIEETSNLDLDQNYYSSTASTSAATTLQFISSNNLQESSTFVTTKKPSSSTLDYSFGSTTDSTQESITGHVKDSTTNPEKLTENTTKFTTRPTYTRRSTTSRTRRTRFTRSTTTKRMPTVEQQNGDDWKPGWLFTTARTTEIVNTEQSSGNLEDLDMSSSTEVTEVNNIKEMFECVPHWKQLSLESSFLYDGIEISSHNSNILSYIGRISINNSQHLGTIVLKPHNLPTFSYYFNNSNQVSTTDTITYLSAAQLQNYLWKTSSNGFAVKNAISINQTGNWPFYIGRIKSNGVIFIGKVLPSIGLVYADKYGIEKISKVYEVLTCETVVNESGGCGIRT